MMTLLSSSADLCTGFTYRSGDAFDASCFTAAKKRSTQPDDSNTCCNSKGLELVLPLVASQFKSCQQHTAGAECG
jgi:hypothetical protein